MSDAPERIWSIGSESPYRINCSILDHSGEPGCTPYLRADIAASQLAEARAEAERWAAQALKEEECRIAWQAERDRLAARLSENNRWPDPLQSPQAEAIRNGKIDMTEIVSLFDKMERELEQLRFVAADNARLEAENDNGGDLTRCEFCGRPILGRIVMDVNFTPSCEECAGAAAIQGGHHE